MFGHMEKSQRSGKKKKEMKMVLNIAIFYEIYFLIKTVKMVYKKYTYSLCSVLLLVFYEVI